MTYEPSLHHKAHIWWKASPWGSTFAVAVGVGLVVAIVSGIWFYFWANEPNAKPEEAPSPKLGLDPRVTAEINRLEFAQMRNREVVYMEVFVKLDKEYSPDELGHFRLLVEVLGSRENATPALRFFVRDGYLTHRKDGVETKLICTSKFAISSEPDELLPVVSHISSHAPEKRDKLGATQELFGKGPFHVLGEFEGKFIRFFATEKLVDKIEYIGFRLDSYIVLGISKDRFHLKKRPPFEAVACRVHAVNRGGRACGMGRVEF